jgi:membrane-associated protease RseP (regulator of RpoE activity)
VALPVFLFVATCLSTFVAGALGHLLTLLEALQAGRVPDAAFFDEMLATGLLYAVPVMIILVCHEAGHFFQAWRYGVRSSLPYFIPMPISPLGTFGAVIAMDAKMGSRKALFDVGITGPLAGLVPTLVFCVWGLSHSKFVPLSNLGLHFGDPLIFKLLSRAILGPTPAGYDVWAHPVAFAGWVGLLVTSLNLLPVGQLDGGHILYALLRRRAGLVAMVVLVGVAIAVVVGAAVYRYPGWILMLVLLLLIGPYHPPTEDDHVRLGPVRTVLGWLTLAFIFVGLTPMPIIP